jgi:hypothetical protein
MEQLYEYLAATEFRQKVEAFVRMVAEPIVQLTVDGSLREFAMMPQLPPSLQSRW